MHPDTSIVSIAKGDMQNPSDVTTTLSRKVGIYTLTYIIHGVQPQELRVTADTSTWSAGATLCEIFDCKRLFSESKPSYMISSESDVLFIKFANVDLRLPMVPMISKPLIDLSDTNAMSDNICQVDNNKTTKAKFGTLRIGYARIINRIWLKSIEDSRVLRITHTDGTTISVLNNVIFTPAIQLGVGILNIWIDGQHYIFAKDDIVDFVNIN